MDAENSCWKIDLQAALAQDMAEFATLRLHLGINWLLLPAEADEGGEG